MASHPVRFIHSPPSTAAQGESGSCGGSRPSLAALLRQVADGFVSVEEAIEMGVCEKLLQLYLASPLTAACVRLREGRWWNE